MSVFVCLCERAHTNVCIERRPQYVPTPATESEYKVVRWYIISFLIIVTKILERNKLIEGFVLKIQHGEDKMLQKARW